MNKESLLAIIFGLFVGLMIFLILSRFQLVINWFRGGQTQPMASITPTMEVKPTIIEGTTPTPTTHKTTLVSPENFFLTKDSSLTLKFKTNPGAVLLVRSNKKISLLSADKEVYSPVVKLEKGSNLIEIFQLTDDLQLNRLASRSGILSSKKYPQGSRGSFGTIKEIKDKTLVLGTPSGQLMVKVTPDSYLYSFTKKGRRVTLTELSQEEVGKKALVIFKPSEKKIGTLIKLMITPDLEWRNLSWFRGKVTKIDDLQKICQLADLHNHVREIKLDKVAIVDFNGKSLKTTEVGLETRVLVIFLDNQPQLMIVSPEVSLIK